MEYSGGACLPVEACGAWEGVWANGSLGGEGRFGDGNESSFGW